LVRCQRNRFLVGTFGAKAFSFVASVRVHFDGIHMMQPEIPWGKHGQDGAFLPEHGDEIAISGETAAQGRSAASP
jgi:hypothetical protein